MSTEIAIRAASLPEKMQYAEALAYSFMLPEQYRKQPANVLWAVEYGETIGITPMAAITGVHMIEGKPTASAALISGLVRRAGHRLRSGYNAATRTGWAEIIRADDPDFTFRSEWNLDRAIEAELVQVGPNGELIAKDSKGRSKPWKKFYPSMTKARAITEVARDACEEVLFGLHYTPEELGADTDDEGNIVTRAAQSAFTADQDPWQTPAPAPAATASATTEGAEAAEYAEVIEDSATPDQIKEIARGFKTVRGVTDAAGVRRTISGVIQREIASARDLTGTEADVILAWLEEEHRQQAEQQPAPNHVQLPTVPEPTPGPAGKPDDEPRQHRLRMMFALINRTGQTKPGAYALASQVFGREITSAKQLTATEVDQFIKLLDTGELPPGAVLSDPAPEDAPGPNANGEGISEFDALDQMIWDVNSDQARAEIEQAITVEVGRQTITATDAGILRERLAAHVKQAKAGASV